MGGWVAYVIKVSPQSQSDLDLGLLWVWVLGLRGPDLGLGLDNSSELTRLNIYANIMYLAGRQLLPKQKDL